MADLAGRQLGNYRLLRPLGQGGFAEVYLAEHIHLKTQAAVKVLRANLADKDLEAFLTEAQTVARLRHPSIIRVLEFGVEGNIPFLAMDYLPRGTLRARYPKGTRLPPSTILPYVQHVAAALHHAHEHKLVHRDVKPENMLLDARDAVLLSDFGTATVAHNSQSYKREAVAGTVAYMAPEQLRGQPRPASDQYALGVVVYEWLVGERPFQGSFSEIASQQLFAPPPSLRAKLPTLVPAIEEVVMRALAKNPKERFASVQDFAAALERVSQDAPRSVEASPMFAAAAPPAQCDQDDEGTLLPTPLPGQCASAAQTAPEKALLPRRPRPARPKVRAAILMAPGILLLIVALALIVLITRSLLPGRQVDAPTAAPTAAQQTRIAHPTATIQATAADPNAPYAATIPGPCDTNGARWIAVGTYQCLSNALQVTRLQGNDDAGVYFSGSVAGSAPLPLNYAFLVNVSHLQGNICVMVSSVFSLASLTPGPPPVPDRIGTLEVDLCANLTLLVYQIPPPNANGPASPIYSAPLASEAGYTIGISCTTPICTISVNNRRIASAPYANVTQVSNIGLTVLGNDSSKVAAGSAEFDHFLFTPSP